ncbi:hypothetical protein [Phenylobacterium sp.]|uniref:hypothetical protein n=1 Tax=Phenylobacterium sp. TaxID=1871053 RepID=UPI002C0C8440|nr:hypothetical protein [Phenylobacterium sp.]HLZ76740.1 hypothetical protein [Phenylobacterium sp.]
MKAAVGGAILSLLLIAGPALAAESASSGLKMDAATQARLGVTTQALQAVRRSASVSGFARVLDPGPLAQLDSDIAAAVATYEASRAEAARTRDLNAADQTVSKQAAEAAASQARQDAAKLALLRKRVGLEWSPALAALSDARRGKLVSDIAAGRASLVRIDSALGLSQMRGSAEIELSGGGRARAAILGPTRTGDPRLQSTGVLALVAGAQASQLGAGTVAPATIAAGGGGEGVMIPRAALLRTGGRTVVYVRKDATDFEQRAVPAGLSDPEGLFVTSGFRAGEVVVTTGAAQLFAAQTKPAGKDVD